MACGCDTYVVDPRLNLCDEFSAGNALKRLCEMGRFSLILFKNNVRKWFKTTDYLEALTCGCVPCNPVEEKCGCTLSGTVLPTEITGVKFNEGDTYAQLNEAGEQIAAFIYTEGAWVAQTEESGEAKRKAL